ncbi:unnamed protein product, partial [Ectocarpus sp. 4 AP-2014]
GRQTHLRLKDDGTGKAAADNAFLRFVVATGQSFDVGQSVYFTDFLEAARSCSTWEPRERQALTTTDLDAEYARVDSTSKELLAEKGLKRGITLQTDGWTGKDGVPRVNIIESIDGQERFLTAEDTTGHKKDMPHLANLMDPYITSNVDLVVADGACAGMLSLIEEKYPQSSMSCMKCGPHGADLLLKDLAKLEFFAEIIRRGTEVSKFVKNHHVTNAIFLEKSKLKLITPNATRFATHLVAAMRMLKVKTALKNFACDPRTADYIRNSSASMRVAGRPAVSEINEGDALEGEFWFELNRFVQLLTPIYELVRMGDGTMPCMSKLLHGF